MQRIIVEEVEEIEEEEQINNQNPFIIENQNDEVQIYGDEVALDENSEGLPEDDPMILNEDEEGSGSSSGEEEEKENDNPQWINAEDWRPPNWLSQYSLVSGASSQVPGNLEKISDYFLLFYDNEVLELIREETNKYADQFFERFPEKRNTLLYSSWQACSKNKIKAYLALVIHMGLSRYPKIEYHWSKSPLYNCAFCKNVMSKKEFLLLHRFLHYADNNTVRSLSNYP